MNPGASGPDLGDQVLVTSAIHHDDGEFAGGKAKALAENLDVLGGRLTDVHLALGCRGRSQFLHVEVGSVEKPTAIRSGKYRHGAALAVGAKVGAFAGINGEIDAWAGATAYFFADVEHGSFIALALTDHDAALHLDEAHAGSHGLNCCSVSFVFFAQAGQFGRGDGSLLNDLENFLDEGAIHGDPAGEWASVME